MLKQNLQNTKKEINNLPLIDWVDNNLSIDLTTWKKKDIVKKYWFMILRDFDWDVAIFKRTPNSLANSETWSYWILHKNWTILNEGFTYFWNWSDWICPFRKNEKYGWINNNWTIIADWYDITDDFKDWLASFLKDWSAGWVHTDLSILAEWFEFCQNFSDEREIDPSEKEILKAVLKWEYIILTKNFINWFSTFRREEPDDYEDDRGPYWWVSSKWKILKDWYMRVYPFNKDYEWVAKFEKNWTTWYIDSKWIEYNWIEERNWRFFLKKWDKLFKHLQPTNIKKIP